jgi:hypothetical protein
MRTSGYTVIVAILILTVLVIVPNSPLYYPLIKYLEWQAKKEWRCDVSTQKADIDILKATLTLKGLYTGTTQASNPTWTLNVKQAVIRFDYPSLIRRPLVLDAVILDNATFVQETKENPSRKSRPAPKAPKKNESTSGKEHGGEEQRKKQTLIKRLVIRNGTFEFKHHRVDGKMHRVKAEQVSFVRKDVFFDKRINTFFRSIITNPVIFE